MPKVPYPYEVNGKLVTGNGSLIPICSLSNHSLLPSLTVLELRNATQTSLIVVEVKPMVSIQEQFVVKSRL